MLFFSKRKINWRKVLIASLIVLVIQMVIRQIEVLLTIKYYMMPEYFGVWSKLMMPKAGPPPQEFFILSILFSFLGVLILACVYECIKNSLEKNFWTRVLGFTKLMILLSLAFGYFPMLLILNIPQALLISWFVSGSFIVFLDAIIFVKVLK